MKKMKKLVSLVLAMVMVMAMTMNVSAAGEGKITINDAVSGQEYSVYQILDLESYNATDNAYAYKATEKWSDFINSDAIKDVYVNVDDQGYVTWKNNLTDADTAEFAKLAQKYAKENNIDAQATQTATSEKVEFTGLDLGYYLVDTTLGTICSLNTTKPEAVIEEKNEEPTITKEVQEDSNSTWGETNDADINQVVNYKATITVQKGAINYIMHDKMSEGLTFDETSVEVMVGDNPVDTSNYELVTECEDGCTFEVVFNDSYIGSLEAGTVVVVYYSAVLNENAKVGTVGNPNEVKLQYSESSEPTYTPEDTTITYTWDMDVLKYANGKEADVLADAQFVLLNSDKSMVANIVNGKFVEWVEFEENDDLSAYALTTDANGKIEIDGLDADTYYLREIKAPAGYNKLAEDVKVVIEAKEVTGENGTTTLEYSTVVAKVNNNSGTELPSTGGMGTTIFYLAGGALVVLAAVLLITRKRMSAE